MMNWMNLQPKRLQSFLFRMFGRKAIIAIKLMNKTENKKTGNLEEKWVSVDIAKLCEQTKFKDKKVRKVINKLKKGNTFYIKDKKAFKRGANNIEIKPTHWFVVQSSSKLDKFLNHHKHLKGEVEKARHDGEKAENKSASSKSNSKK